MPSFPAVVVPPAEDRASHERHLKCLKQECRNVRPNKLVTIHILYFSILIITLGLFNPQVTKELRKRTFLFRRQDILGGSFTMDLFSTYPPLKDPEEFFFHM